MNEQGVILLGEAAKDFVVFKYVELFTLVGFILATIVGACLFVRWYLKEG